MAALSNKKSLQLRPAAAAHQHQLAAAALLHRSIDLFVNQSIRTRRQRSQHKRRLARACTSQRASHRLGRICQLPGPKHGRHYFGTWPQLTASNWRTLQ